jgi:putative aldouronate transport system permease protein
MINEVKSQKLKGVIRTISYLPSFISWIAVGGMMVVLFSVDNGILNSILSNILGREVKINWYAEDQYWWMILALSSINLLNCTEWNLFDSVH